MPNSRCLLGKRKVRRSGSTYVSNQFGGSMQVGDLVKTCEGDYGIVSGFWNSDVDGTLYVEV